VHLFCDPGVVPGVVLLPLTHSMEEVGGWDVRYLGNLVGFKNIWFKLALSQSTHSHIEVEDTSVLRAVGRASLCGSVINGAHLF
jgi:hypothetical protein